MWDDADIAAFVASHYPLVKDLFDAFLIPVERADIFRCVWSHASGNKTCCWGQPCDEQTPLASISS